MATQLHRRFGDEHVKVILELYQNQGITLDNVLQDLGCGRSRFFELFKQYRQDPDHFTIAYRRRQAQHRLDSTLDQIIREELEKDCQLIRDRETPITNYNYAYIRDQVRQRTGQLISAQTIRNRAKTWGYYYPKRKKEKAIPREVVTQAIGMLLQHDSSHHKWSPYAPYKWTLITTLDDHSRYLLYADLVEKESTWAHIQALQAVVGKYGVGRLFYVDRHSIFRYVCCHQSIWRHQRKALLEETLTKWRRVMEKCNMRVIHALSPQAKGKVERPYRWMQDRIVRSCARTRITDLNQARLILQQEVQRYNEHQVHSTTGEIPALRFKRAIREGRNCFQPFKPATIYKSRKDIFCLHEFRKVDGYNQISWQGLKHKLPMLLPAGTTIELHIVPQDEQTEVRLWFKDKVVKVIYCNN